MPARSNSFQRLVRAIQGHLSRSGTVTESRFLQDKDTGSLVEVDIVIEEKIGGHTVLVGIECTAEKRKATIEWYREMRAKHADLPIAKTVLVARAGFTKEVARKAKKDNIELMTLAQSESFMWESLFAKIKNGTLADVGFTLREISVTFHTAADKALTLEVTPDTLVRGSEFELPLGQLIMETALQGGLTTAIMSRLGEIIKKTNHFAFEFGVPPGTNLMLGDRQLEFSRVAAVLTIHPRFQSLQLDPIDFNGQTVAAGAFPANFLVPGAEGESVMTISERSDSTVRVSILGAADRDLELDVFPHALVPSAS